jgi:3-hydroxyisobutyrate dehydrogenase-like beta-hydroxyacid dehydrogenase
MNEARPLRLGIYGYGEVGHGLALGLRNAGLHEISAYQRQPHTALTRERARESQVRLVASPAELAAVADVVIAVTQGSASLDAARAIRDHLEARHRYVDLASATARTKSQIADLLAPTGALFADGAIEGSPLTHGHALPILLSGPAARELAAALNPWGMRIEVVSEKIGHASAIKSLRHVLMKGQIALLIECFVAARRCGLGDEVLASVAQWYDEVPFRENAERLLVTTAVHARRRTEEAQMAMSMLEEAGVEPIMTASTVRLLERIADLDLRSRLGGVLPESAAKAVELFDDYARKR